MLSFIASNAEFRKVLNGFKMSETLVAGGEIFVPKPGAKLPDSVDWRTKGYVTPIKNQGQCGSCWAFSATGSLEGQWFNKTGTLVSLSEQDLVDCSKKEGNQGCEGGLMDQAFTYVAKNKGIDTEASYPYKAKDEKCKFKPADVGANDTGFVDITSGNENDLQEAIATVGPSPWPSTPATTPSSCTSPACTTRRSAALSSWTTEFWLSAMALIAQMNTTSLKIAGALPGECKATSRCPEIARTTVASPPWPATPKCRKSSSAALQSPASGTPACIE
ncbi:hypothetical protein C0Q70_03376 [Pomacea canaliculata]|uniref:Peptidase C1A papain C-terminal domain-containing protein n=1 Tax=Pomacea canaliculata TaxID=400727 RepID=A0A2T7PSK5_POMCA|nr:hypothetical protein C0Q70_03376 [Pomacea canaliculata]